MRAMAEVRGDDLEALCAAVDANTEAAFGGRLVSRDGLPDDRRDAGHVGAEIVAVRGLASPASDRYRLVTVGRDRERFASARRRCMSRLRESPARISPHHTGGHGCPRTR